MSSLIHHMRVVVHISVRSSPFLHFTHVHVFCVVWITPFYIPLKHSKIICIWSIVASNSHRYCTVILHYWHAVTYSVGMAEESPYLHWHIDQSVRRLRLCNLERKTKKQHNCIKLRITNILYLYCIAWDLIHFYLKELKMIEKIY